jgi:hypothetical protein
MLGAIWAAALDNVRMSLSAGLSATGGGATVTGNTSTWTVPTGHPGVIRFTVGGSGTTQYSKNGGAFITVVTNDEVTFANGDTIAMQTTGLTSGQTGTATLRDKFSGTTFGAYTWSRM